MPTYEYECGKCSYVFEELQSINEKPIEKCPECKGKVNRLINGGAGIVFKGSGFYINDSKKKTESSVSPTAEKTKKTSADVKTA